MMRTIEIPSMIGLVAIAVLALGSSAGGQADAPTTTNAAKIVLPQGPLQVTVTGVEGIVRARPSPTDKWVRATVGMVLGEGAEFQTGPRSAVRFVIPPDQTVALDRLGTIKILRANFENGKLFTDLGMTYGRTRFDIESAGGDHDAKVHSPSAVMAIRGTQVSLFDQVPFTPEAISLRGKAHFTVGGKVIPFGGKQEGKATINASSDSVAQAALNQTTIDPKGSFAGRTQTDLDFQIVQASIAGTDLASGGILSAVAKPVMVVPVPMVEEQLLINLSFLSEGAAESDADLTIRDPLGQVLSAGSPSTADGGVYQGKAFSGGIGQVNAAYLTSFPAGNYTFTESLASGTTQAMTNLNLAELNPSTGAQANVGPIAATLTTANPTFTFTDTFPKALGTGGTTPANVTPTPTPAPEPTPTPTPSSTAAERQRFPAIATEKLARR